MLPQLTKGNLSLFELLEAGIELTQQQQLTAGRKREIINNAYDALGVFPIKRKMGVHLKTEVTLDNLRERLIISMNDLTRILISGSYSHYAHSAYESIEMIKQMTPQQIAVSVTDKFSQYSFCSVADYSAFDGS